LFNILLQTLPGAAITYQGEELVMTNVHLTWNETVDPLACNTNPEVYESVSRDPARTPFPWDDSKNAGFSNGSTTWLPVGDHYRTVNVKAQSSAENSHLKIFKKLVALRKKAVLNNKNYVGNLTNNDNVYAYKRQNGNDVAIIVLNFGVNEETVDLIKLYPLIPNKLKVYTSSLNSGLKDE
jgi:alpha-glucosidase